MGASRRDHMTAPALAVQLDFALYLRSWLSIAQLPFMALSGHSTTRCKSTVSNGVITRIARSLIPSERERVAAGSCMRFESLGCCFYSHRAARSKSHFFSIISYCARTDHTASSRAFHCASQPSTRSLQTTPGASWTTGALKFRRWRTRASQSGRMASSSSISADPGANQRWLSVPPSIPKPYQPVMPFPPSAAATRDATSQGSKAAPQKTRSRVGCVFA